MDKDLQEKMKYKEMFLSHIENLEPEEDEFKKAKSKLE